MGSDKPAFKGFRSACWLCRLNTVRPFAKNPPGEQAGHLGADEHSFRVDEKSPPMRAATAMTPPIFPARAVRDYTNDRFEEL
jgi:hypothetical protein